MRDAGKRLIQSAHEAAAMAKGTPPMTQDPQFTAEKLARRIIELDPDPAAVELAAHLKRQFDVGFNAGIEAARKEMDAAANAIELMCLNGGIRPPDEVIVLASAVKMVRDKANTISALTVPSDLVAVPKTTDGDWQDENEAVERSLDWIDAEADKWAEEVSLHTIIENMASIANLSKNGPENERNKLIDRWKNNASNMFRQTFLEAWVRCHDSYKEYRDAKEARAMLSAYEKEKG